MDLYMLADCPECGLPATVTSHGRAASTDGPVEMVKLRCVILHWFLGSADTLLHGGWRHRADHDERADRHDETRP
jgi:hypothetical protein